MSSDEVPGSAQSAEAKHREEALEAEWANVGLVAGLHRPCNGQRAAARRHASRDINEANWQPHQRCCR